MQQTVVSVQQSNIPSRHAPVGISQSNGSSCVAVVTIDVALETVVHCGSSVTVAITIGWGTLGSGFGAGSSTRRSPC